MFRCGITQVENCISQGNSFEVRELPSGLETAGCQWSKAGHILEMAGRNKFELPSKKKWQVKFYRYISFYLPQLIYTRLFS
jgi:hypothetical protein